MKELYHTTFWELLSEHKIEVPVIQRDYAQGREDKRVAQIRERFVKTLIDSIQNNEEISLDFIYGKIDGKEKALILEKNKEAVNAMLRAVKGYAKELNLGIDYKLQQTSHVFDYLGTKFIPLDGQQRLTTLFLLHWYVVQRLQPRSITEELSVLEGFGYQTRKTTKDFCKAITREENCLNQEVFGADQLSNSIRNSTWFFQNWLRDPSVKGMLVVLDEIHHHLKGVSDFQLFWDGLSVKRLVRFDFLDLNELEQTDELYVKMNARGKQLTDFEHFKAWLQLHLNKSQIEVAESEWEFKLDTDWYDLFWQAKPSGEYNVDKVIYDFFKSIGLLAYVQNVEKGEHNKALIETIIGGKQSFISLSEFVENGFFNEVGLNLIFTALNKLHSSDLAQHAKWLEDIYCDPFTRKSSDITTQLLSSNNAPSDYYERVYQCAYLLFLEQIEEVSEEDLESRFKDWMRITRNLVYNTYIQNRDNFIDAIKALKKLSQHKYNIVEFLKSSEAELSFYSKIQLEEEILKLEYFSHEGFKEAIVDLENHWYLYGQIGFLFRILPEESKYDLEKFKSLDERIKYYLSSETEPFEFERKLLSVDDYFIRLSGYRQSFCRSDVSSLRARNDNWRKVFNAKEGSRSFTALSKVLSLDPKDFELAEPTDWRKYFVYYPAIMGYCREALIDFYDPLDIRLIKKKTYNGKHADLYSYILYQYFDLLKAKYQSFSFHYRDVNNWRTDKSIPHFVVQKNGSDFLEVYYYPKYGGDIRRYKLILCSGLFPDFAPSLIASSQRERVKHVDSLDDIDSMFNLIASLLDDTNG